MKSIFAFVLLISSSLLLLSRAEETEELTLESCSCWDGYKPQMVGEKPMCVGVMLMALKPCNIPQAPRCVCDPAEATGITTDAQGTRCSKYVKGVEEKSWPCANQEEWEVFKKSLEKKPHH